MKFVFDRVQIRIHFLGHINYEINRIRIRMQTLKYQFLVSHTRLAAKYVDHKNLKSDIFLQLHNNNDNDNKNLHPWRHINHSKFAQKKRRIRVQISIPHFRDEIQNGIPRAHFLRRPTSESMPQRKERHIHPFVINKSVHGTNYLAPTIKDEEKKQVNSLKSQDNFCNCRKKNSMKSFSKTRMKRKKKL